MGREISLISSRRGKFTEEHAISESLGSFAGIVLARQYMAVCDEPASVRTMDSEYFLTSFKSFLESEKLLGVQIILYDKIFQFYSNTFSGSGFYFVILNTKSTFICNDVSH